MSHDEDRDERPELLEAPGQLLGAGVPGVLPRKGAPAGDLLSSGRRGARDLSHELFRRPGEPHEVPPGKRFESSHRSRDDSAAGCERLVELDRIRRVGQLREPERNHLDVEPAPDRGHVAVGTLPEKYDIVAKP